MDSLLYIFVHIMKRLEIYRLEYYSPFLNETDKRYDYFNKKNMPTPLNQNTHKYSNIFWLKYPIKLRFLPLILKFYDESEYIIRLMIR